MGNLHEVVVDDIGEVVGRQFVGTLIEHLIVEDVALDAHLATNEVVDEDFLARLNLESHHILLSVGNEALHLVLREGEGVAHLHARAGIILEIRHLGALSLKFLRGVEGYVSLASVEELINILLIYLATLALTVGTFVATERNALVELNAEPAKRLEDVFLSPRHETCGVGILDAED